MPFITIRGRNFDVEYVDSWEFTPEGEKKSMSRLSAEGELISQRPQELREVIPARLFLTFKKGYGPNFVPIVLHGDQATEANGIIETFKSAKG